MLGRTGFQRIGRIGNSVSGPPQHCNELIYICFSLSGYNVVNMHYSYNDCNRAQGLGAKFKIYMHFRATTTTRRYENSNIYKILTRLSCHLYCRTLNNNNITALPRDVFTGMPRIRALRLSDNPFACDCHLSWLSRFLRSAPRLAPYTRCHSPSQLKGQNVADLHDQEFKCSG